MNRSVSISGLRVGALCLRPLSFAAGWAGWGQHPPLHPAVLVPPRDPAVGGRARGTAGCSAERSAGPRGPGDPAEDPALLALGVGFLKDLPAGMSFPGFGGTRWRVEVTPRALGGRTLVLSLAGPWPSAVGSGWMLAACLLPACCRVYLARPYCVGPPTPCCCHSYSAI